MLEILFKICYKYIEWCSRNFRSLESFFILLGGMMKEYKNNKELIDYIISKNVIVNDKEKALENIEKYSYYSIINGYKAIFKDENNNYKKNTSFEEIFALYEFDKNIKAIFLKFTLEIEVIIKSLMANTLAKEYGVEHYLKLDNLDENTNKDLINDFIEKIEKEIDDNYIKHPAINHYKDTYKFVPPFVLTKILTFGAISRYYSLLKQSDRQKISKYFKLSDKLLKQILINLTMVRNISAHSDRLFNYRNKYDISFKNIEKGYNRKEYLCNLYMIIKCMQVLLDKEKYKEFENLLNSEIEKLTSKLIVVDINDILRIMGYDV